MTKRNILKSTQEPIHNVAQKQKQVMSEVDAQPVVSHATEMMNTELMNTELMMFQQMCSMFGKQFTISLATEYLDKLNYDISNSEVKEMYSKEIFTLITDFRDNRIEQLQKLLDGKIE
jgi:hypothetical protein